MRRMQRGAEWKQRVILDTLALCVTLPGRGSKKKARRRKVGSDRAHVPAEAPGRRLALISSAGVRPLLTIPCDEPC